jgi:hypothetical protein
MGQCPVWVVGHSGIDLLPRPFFRKADLTR